MKSQTQKKKQQKKKKKKKKKQTDAQTKKNCNRGTALEPSVGHLLLGRGGVGEKVKLVLLVLNP